MTQRIDVSDWLDPWIVNLIEYLPGNVPLELRVVQSSRVVLSYLLLHSQLVMLDLGVSMLHMGTVLLFELDTSGNQSGREEVAFPHSSGGSIYLNLVF